ncbi:long-chain acyl-CoA synthetase [Micromonospora phaseoli]|uniref:Long-chain acyl-CoA synthetase n=1 Tax=Micromonospora phaseoli TaxID=1144548 RepID=A0A1H6XH74_9ACTN|nr:AMP-binding protein [Micromonospora phaseoli]PZW02197.1 long-chain acyl-CoA synthetase [Micromonospora phaseoli]GIJ75801.1 long-chain acyl-CoA synthetase [Micromonospora phaseoli]SEJ26874.1 long-chain acyl-CoA synthetase [Micromonospora phaseoli]
MVQDPDAASGPNLADRLRRAARLHAGKPALHWQDRTITWSELDVAVTGTARALAQAVSDVPATEPPARVAVALPNSPEFVIGLLGALRAGLTAVPVNPGLTARELRHVLVDSGASVLIGTERIRDLLASADLPALNTVHTTPPTAAGEQAFPLRRADDLAMLLYTSGTSGWPKGAMLSHGALAANHEQIGRIAPPVVGPDDTVLLALPLFHAYGLNTGLGAVIQHGATGVLVDDPGPEAALAEIARHRVSVLVGVPSMVQAWSRAPADTLVAAMAAVRVVVCGAAPLEPADAARFAEAAGRPVHIGYGLTETAPVLTSTLVGGEPKAGSIGRPLPGVQVRLVGADGVEQWRDGVAAPDDDPDELDLSDPASGTDPGQVVVRGPNLFSGYWPDGMGGADADGWWATGDVAYADADGDLYLVDRLGELILVNGFNVYPHEVELVLSAHPAVVESAVVGVPHPRTGETVRAYVVPVPGARVTGPELIAHSARNLARFKCPTGVEFVDVLPRSAIGKVRKTLLRPRPDAADWVLPTVPSPASPPETEQPAPAGTTEETDA